jgi:hypothetical protein
MLQVSKLLKIGLQPLQASQELFLYALQRLHGLFWEAENGRKQPLQVQSQPFRRYLTVCRVSWFFMYVANIAQAFGHDAQAWAKYQCPS